MTLNLNPLPFDEDPRLFRFPPFFSSPLRQADGRGRVVRLGAGRGEPRPRGKRPWKVPCRFAELVRLSEWVRVTPLVGRQASP